ncbi:MAG: helix-turn-helix domain-containing protein [candidate division NC10 bacterium]|nr:helix-turn-helix domain-containing protein [candidate division NC10 bacterium]
MEDRFGKFPVAVVTSGAWASLSVKAKAVYPVLLAYARWSNRQAWPSNERLAKEAGVNIRSIPAATAELERRGLLKKWRHDRKNYYHLPLDGFPLSPSQMETKTPTATGLPLSPSRMEIKTPPSASLRPRSVRGHFTRIGKQMEVPSPSQVDSVPPSQMETKEKYLKRGIEREGEKETRLSSFQGEASGTPPPRTPSPASLSQGEGGKPVSPQIPPSLPVGDNAQVLIEQQKQEEADQKRRDLLNMRESIRGLVQAKGIAWVRDYLTRRDYPLDVVQAVLNDGADSSAPEPPPVRRHPWKRCQQFLSPSAKKRFTIREKREVLKRGKL